MHSDSITGSTECQLLLLPLSGVLFHSHRLPLTGTGWAGHGWPSDSERSSVLHLQPHRAGEFNCIYYYVTILLYYHVTVL